MAPNGDLYVTDGYASDYIHRFGREGRYLASFGGKQAHYGFRTLHKLAIDTRFQPARLLACDREMLHKAAVTPRGSNQASFYGVRLDVLSPLGPAIASLAGKAIVA